VQAELKQGVDTIYSTYGAFAAVMKDGSVVTWGDSNYGGDSSLVQAELKQGVDTIYSNYGAFAAKMQDGSVVTWGNPITGGDSSQVQAELKQWMNEHHNVHSFLHSIYTSDLASLTGQYYGNIQIYSSHKSFIAVIPNHAVVQW
jgi:hypothetical protein